MLREKSRFGFTNTERSRILPALCPSKPVGKAVSVNDIPINPAAVPEIYVSSSICSSNVRLQRVGESPWPRPPARDSRLQPRPAPLLPLPGCGCPRLPPASAPTPKAYFHAAARQLFKKAHMTLLHQILQGLLITLEIKPRLPSVTSEIRSDLGSHRPAGRSRHRSHARSPGPAVCCVCGPGLGDFVRDVGSACKAPRSAVRRTDFLSFGARSVHPLVRLFRTTL